MGKIFNFGGSTPAPNNGTGDDNVSATEQAAINAGASSAVGSYATTQAQRDSEQDNAIFSEQGVSDAEQVAIDALKTEANQANQLIKSDANNRYPALDGSLIRRTDRLITAAQLLGAPAKFEGLGCLGMDSASTIILTSGQARLFAFWLSEETSLSWLGFMMKTTGAYTGTGLENRLAIYRVNEDRSYTMVGTTASEENMWKGANNVLQTRNLVAPVTLPAGLYFLAMIWNSSATTTAPALLGATVSVAITTAYNSGNAARLFAQLVTANLPENIPANGLGGNTSRIWFIGG